MNNRHRRRRSDEERGPVSYALCAARVRTYLRIRPCARTYVQSALVPASKGHAPNVRTEHPRLRRLADRLRRQSHLVERACLRTYVREDACCLRVCPPSTRMSSSLLASVGSSCSCWICATIAWPCSRSLSKASLTTCLMLSSLDLRRIVLRLRFLFITYVRTPAWGAFANTSNAASLDHGGASSTEAVGVETCVADRSWLVAFLKWRAAPCSRILAHWAGKNSLRTYVRTYVRTYIRTYVNCKQRVQSCMRTYFAPVLRRNTRIRTYVRELQATRSIVHANVRSVRNPTQHTNTYVRTYVRTHIYVRTYLI